MVGLGGGVASADASEDAEADERDSQSDDGGDQRDVDGSAGGVHHFVSDTAIGGVKQCVDVIGVVDGVSSRSGRHILTEVCIAFLSVE